MDRRLQPSAYGSFDLTYLAPTDASLGVYQVRVVRADDDEAEERESWQTGDLAQGTFRVDAFRAATFAVDAVPAARAFVAGDFFEGTVTGRYLFGAAMGGQALRYRLVQQNGRYTPPGYDAYRFGIARGYYSLYETLAQGDTVLTADGTKQLRVPLPGNERGAPASLQFSATVTDPSRQEQSDQTTVTLHPGLFYIGLKPETTFLDLSRDQVMALDVATVDPNGAPVGAENLTVELIRQQWNSVREVGGDGLGGGLGDAVDADERVHEKRREEHLVLAGAQPPRLGGGRVRARRQDAVAVRVAERVEERLLDQRVLGGRAHGATRTAPVRRSWRSPALI